MDVHQLEEKSGSLLTSQETFIYSDALYSVIDGGWGSGKSHALVTKGLILSAAIPGNVGLIGRFNSTDLEDSTMALFFDVCPPSWIKKYNKTRKILTFHNNSQILFRHINDPNPKRKHITSTNLGWFAVDQMEEIEEEHWNTLTGRLRLPRAPKRFGFGAANPNGKDWIYKKFYASVPPERLSEFATKYRNGVKLGVAVRSEENKKSNGGFVDDDYFENLRNEMPREWVARFLDCSFEDFSGKIYKEYVLDSVHNIDPFPIPAHWETYVGIDVGGDAPWSVGIWRIDEQGNMIRTKEMYKPTVLSSEVASFIKSSADWKNQHFTPVIDPENKLAMLELAEYDIYCRPARKGQGSVKPGIIKQGGYMHVNPTVQLPQWYRDTQPAPQIAKFEKAGSPRMFSFKTCTHWRREHDEYHWDDRRPGHPKKENDHTCDETRYVCDLRPQPSELKHEENPQLAKLKVLQPAAYDEWKAFDARMEARRNRKGGKGMLLELGSDSNEHFSDVQRNDELRGRFDWGEN